MDNDMSTRSMHRTSTPNALLWLECAKIDIRQLFKIEIIALIFHGLAREYGAELWLNSTI